jgi:hypothetical protein
MKPVEKAYVPLHYVSMHRLDRAAAGALRALLEPQPLTEAKVLFAWRIAAGPALARNAAASWSDGRLIVRADSGAWRLELVRAKGVIADRLRQMLGPGAVSAIHILDR